MVGVADIGSLLMESREGGCLIATNHHLIQSSHSSKAAGKPLVNQELSVHGLNQLWLLSISFKNPVACTHGQDLSSLVR